MNTYTLKDLVTIKNGRDHKHLADGKFPVYGSGGIMRYAESYLYDKPSILLPRKGTLDNIQFCEVPFWTVDTSYYTEVNETLCNPYYLYCYLNLLDLSKLNTGTGVPSMTFDSYYNIKIHLPSKSIQDKIAKFLSTLDRKISLNRSINAELERMAKEIYDYWFVQFEFPDEHGRPYKSSGGAMVYNPVLKREVPQGWEVKELSKICKTKLGGTPDTSREEFWNGEFQWLNSGEVAEFPIVESEKSITQEGIDGSATSFLKAGSITLSITRHLRPSILAIDACINQSVVGIEENDIFKKSFIYPYLSREIPRLMTLRVGAQQPHINKETIDVSSIVIPPNEILKKYYETVDDIYEAIINNALQNKKLTSLRDELLPLLMTGQVGMK